MAFRRKESEGAAISLLLVGLMVLGSVGATAGARSAATVGSAGGSGSASGSFLTLAPKPQSTVTFTETGLPSGTEWWVNLTNGQTFNSLSNTITFSEPKGGYTYAVATTNKSYSAPGGSFSVHGATQVSVTFSLVTYSVTFTESGLPSGAEWWVNLTNGQSFSATTNTISFHEPNGTYAYTVATAGRSYSAPGGSFTVNGVSVSETVTFLHVTYAVTFTESGLPLGMEWWVNLTNGETFSSETAILTFSEPNGTYTYGVGVSDNTYSASGGTFSVHGAPVSETVTFTRVTYTVTFTESGLPSGSEWWLNVSGQTSQSSMGSMIALSLPNGTYTYSATTTNKLYFAAGGTFTVAGTTVSVPVVFSFLTYPAAFTESGLPTGSEWWVNVSGQASRSSTSTAMVLNLPDGTYTYGVATGDKTYFAFGGTFAVSGAPVSVAVTFTRVTYPVTFTESGLPSGSDWWVNLTNGPSFAGTGPTISFAEPNGTYGYVATSDGWQSTPSGGTFTVNGAPASESLSFTQVRYVITFQETGLTSGTKWSVTLNGLTKSSTTSTIPFGEPNNTYSYTVGAVSGYRSNVTSGSVTVAGSPRSISLNFTSTSSGGGGTSSGGGGSPSSSAGLNAMDWAVIGVVALATVAVAFAMRSRKRSGGAAAIVPPEGATQAPPPKQTQ